MPTHPALFTGHLLRLPALFSLVALLSACTFTVSIGPTPTVSAPATSTPAPALATDTAAPALPSDTAAAPATDTPANPPDTPAPTAAPPEVPEVILITAPGINSQLTSPLRVEGIADPTFEQNLVIQITNADGVVLATQPTTIQAEAGSRGPFAADVAFSTPSDQPGRISVFAASARDGGLVHLASVEVELLASGAAVVAPAVNHPETHIILDPPALAEARGGNLQVVGYSEYVFESMLGLVLCGEGGAGAPDPLCGTADNVLATGLATLASADIGLPGPFTGTLPYSVSAPVSARLVVYSTSPRDGGLLHLATVPITLNP
ncbi:MAG: hypothetical protein IT317_00855 [Anaerolineales bacterium]|nr:hypothetical protein [Anaerolineales bacterium]